MKDEVKIYDKLDKNIIKTFTISTIFTKTYYFKDRTLLFLHYFYFTLFYITNNIKKSTIFYYFYYIPTFYTKT